MPAASACVAAQARLLEVGRCASRRGRRRSAPARPSRAGAGTRARAAYSRARAKPLRNSASRPGRQAMPRSPLAKSPGGALKSTCCRPCRASSVGQRRCRPFVGKQELDGLESVGCRGGEAIEERMLAVHHAEVGGKARHRGPSSSPARAELAAQLVDLRRRQRLGLRLGSQPEARRLLELLEHRHRCRRRRMPDVRAEPRQHDGADRRAALARAWRSPRRRGSPTAGSPGRWYAISGTWPTFITK